MGVHESPYSATRTEEPTATATSTSTPAPTSSETPTPTTTPEHTSTPNNEFVDVNNETISWAADQIKELATAGIIKGYNEDGQWLFKPNNNITRAEYATLLTKAFNLLDETAVSNFTDVVPGDWEYAYVAVASKLGIVKGISETEFAPDSNITRQDMATMMYRIYKNVLGAPAISSDKIDEALSIFSDQSKIDGYAREGVATMSHDGIIKGIGEGVDKCFAPLDNSTRAESAVVISRVLNK